MFGWFSKTSKKEGAVAGPAAGPAVSIEASGHTPSLSQAGGSGASAEGESSRAASAVPVGNGTQSSSTGSAGIATRGKINFRGDRAAIAVASIAAARVMMGPAAASSPLRGENGLAADVHMPVLPTSGESLPETTTVVPTRKGFNFRQRKTGGGASYAAAGAASDLNSHESLAPDSLRKPTNQASGLSRQAAVNEVRSVGAAATTQAKDAPPQSRVRYAVRAAELLTHSHEFSSDDLVLNPEYFQGWAAGDFVVLRPVADHGPTGDAAGPASAALNRASSLLLRVQSIAPVRGSLQVSLAASTADALGWHARQQIEVRRLDGPDQAAALFGLAHVEVSFKDQYASRSGMWRFRNALTGATVHRAQTVQAYGLRMQVKDLGAAADASVGSTLSGLVTPATKFTFRSRSSQMALLVQMSREMWQFDNDGELYFEKLVNRFLSTLFARWSAIGATHAVTLVLFSRTYYDLSAGQLMELGGFNQHQQAPSSSRLGAAHNCKHTDYARLPTAAKPLREEGQPQRSTTALSEEAEFDGIIADHSRPDTFSSDGSSAADDESNHASPMLPPASITTSDEKSLAEEARLFWRNRGSENIKLDAAESELPQNQPSRCCGLCCCACGNMLGNANGCGDNRPSMSLQSRALCIDAEGRLYEDTYLTVAEDCVVQPAIAASVSASIAGGATPGHNLAAPAADGTQGTSSSSSASNMAEWHRVLRSLKRSFSQYPDVANWGFVNAGAEVSAQAASSGPRSHDKNSACHFCDACAARKAISAPTGASAAATQSSGASEMSPSQGVPSISSQGNFLEAINLCLNGFEHHVMDRDMHRMGQNVIVLTAGAGLFDVDPVLAQMTKQRMMDNGIGCDVVSMARPPLHMVPLFATRRRQYHSHAGIDFQAASAAQVEGIVRVAKSKSAGDDAAEAGADIARKLQPHALALQQGRTVDLEEGEAAAATSLEPPALRQSVMISYSQPHWVHCSFFGHVSHLYSALATANPLDSEPESTQGSTDSLTSGMFLPFAIPALGSTGSNRDANFARASDFSTSPSSSFLVDSGCARGAIVGGDRGVVSPAQIGRSPGISISGADHARDSRSMDGGGGLISVGAASAGNLPSAITARNPMLNDWVAASASASFSPLMVRARNYFAGHGASVGALSLVSLMAHAVALTSHNIGPAVSNVSTLAAGTAYSPYPFSHLFSLYAPRLSTVGPTYPPALLETLRRCGRVASVALGYDARFSRDAERATEFPAGRIRSSGLGSIMRAESAQTGLSQSSGASMQLPFAYAEKLGGSQFDSPNEKLNGTPSFHGQEVGLVVRDSQGMAVVADTRALKLEAGYAKGSSSRSRAHSESASRTAILASRESSSHPLCHRNDGGVATGADMLDQQHMLSTTIQESTGADDDDVAIIASPSSPSIGRMGLSSITNSRSPQLQAVTSLGSLSSASSFKKGSGATRPSPALSGSIGRRARVVSYGSIGNLQTIREAHARSTVTASALGPSVLNPASLAEASTESSLQTEPRDAWVAKLRRRDPVRRSYVPHGIDGGGSVGRLTPLQPSHSVMHDESLQITSNLRGVAALRAVLASSGKHGHHHTIGHRALTSAMERRRSPFASSAIASVENSRRREAMGEAASLQRASSAPMLPATAPQAVSAHFISSVAGQVLQETQNQLSWGTELARFSLTPAAALQGLINDANVCRKVNTAGSDKGKSSSIESSEPDIQRSTSRSSLHSNDAERPYVGATGHKIRSRSYPQPLGLSGHDDFGFVMVEAPLPGIGAALLRHNPSNVQLYPWSRLLQRLTRRIAALTSSSLLSNKSGVTSVTILSGVRARSSEHYSRLYQRYRVHDETIFSSKLASPIVASRSIVGLANALQLEAALEEKEHLGASNRSQVSDSLGMSLSQTNLQQPTVPSVQEHAATTPYPRALCLQLQSITVGTVMLDNLKSSELLSSSWKPRLIGNTSSAAGEDAVLNKWKLCCSNSSIAPVAAAAQSLSLFAAAELDIPQSTVRGCAYIRRFSPPATYIFPSVAHDSHTYHDAASGHPSNPTAMSTLAAESSFADAVTDTSPLLLPLEMLALLALSPLTKLRISSYLSNFIKTAVSFCDETDVSEIDMLALAALFVFPRDAILQEFSPPIAIVPAAVADEEMTAYYHVQSGSIDQSSNSSGGNNASQRLTRHSAESQPAKSSFFVGDASSFGACDGEHELPGKAGNRPVTQSKPCNSLENTRMEDSLQTLLWSVLLGIGLGTDAPTSALSLLKIAPAGVVARKSKCSSAMYENEFDTGALLLSRILPLWLFPADVVEMLETSEDRAFETLNASAGSDHDNLDSGSVLPDNAKRRRVHHGAKSRSHAVAADTNMVNNDKEIALLDTVAFTELSGLVDSSASDPLRRVLTLQNPGSASAWDAPTGAQHAPHGSVAGFFLNPFQQRSADVAVSTANRRRWWHMFPTEQLPQQQITTPAVGGVSGLVTLKPSKDSCQGQDGPNMVALLQSFLPNWKSLCEPAVMPLTTDFLPPPLELSSQFAESAYSVLLPRLALSELTALTSDSSHSIHRGVNPGNSMQISLKGRALLLQSFHESIVDEMVCQRLAQDFQLVEGGSTLQGTIHMGSNVQAANSPVSWPVHSQRDFSGSGDVRVIHLSMGHRIHKLVYNAEEGTVDVQMYFKKPHEKVGVSPDSAAGAKSGVPWPPRAISSAHSGLQARPSNLVPETARASQTSIASIFGHRAMTTNNESLSVSSHAPPLSSQPQRGMLATSGASGATLDSQPTFASPSMAFGSASSLHGEAFDLRLHSLPLPGSALLVRSMAVQTTRIAASLSPGSVQGLASMQLQSASARTNRLQCAAAVAMAQLSQMIAPSFVDRDGVYQYRYMLWCPFRRRTVPTVRRFVVPAASALQTIVGWVPPEVESAAAVFLAASGEKKRTQPVRNAAQHGAGLSLREELAASAARVAASPPVREPSAIFDAIHAVAHSGEVAVSHRIPTGNWVTVSLPHAAAAAGQRPASLSEGRSEPDCAAGPGSSVDSRGSASALRCDLQALLHSKANDEVHNMAAANSADKSARVLSAAVSAAAAAAVSSEQARFPVSMAPISAKYAAAARLRVQNTGSSQLGGGGGGGGTMASPSVQLHGMFLGPATAATAAALLPSPASLSLAPRLSLMQGDFHWNYLDQLLTGDEDRLDEGVCYRRVNLLLLPLPQQQQASPSLPSSVAASGSKISAAADSPQQKAQQQYAREVLGRCASFEKFWSHIHVRLPLPASAAPQHASPVLRPAAAPGSSPSAPSNGGCGPHSLPLPPATRAAQHAPAATPASPAAIGCPRKPHEYVPVRVHVPLPQFSGAAHGEATAAATAVLLPQEPTPAAAELSPTASAAAGGPHLAAAVSSTAAEEATISASDRAPSRGVSFSGSASVGGGGGGGGTAAAGRFVATAGGVLKLLETAAWDDSALQHTVRLDLRGGSGGSRGGGSGGAGFDGGGGGPVHAPFEWVQVAYGGVYSPLRAFPLSVRWLTASFAAVEALLAALGRRARQSGFALVQVPEYSRRFLRPGVFAAGAVPRVAPGRLAAAAAAGAYPASQQQLDRGTGGGESAFDVPAKLNLPVFLSPVPLPLSDGLHAELAAAAEARPHQTGRPETAAAAAAPAEAVAAAPASPSLESPPLPQLQRLLLGTPAQLLPLLLHLEVALVLRFGFLPDFAAGGAGADSLAHAKAALALRQAAVAAEGALRRASASQSASPSVAAFAAAVAPRASPPPLPPLSPQQQQQQQPVSRSAAAVTLSPQQSVSRSESWTAVAPEAAAGAPASAAAGGSQRRPSSAGRGLTHADAAVAAATERNRSMSSVASETSVLSPGAAPTRPVSAQPPQAATASAAGQRQHQQRSAFSPQLPPPVASSAGKAPIISAAATGGGSAGSGDQLIASRLYATVEFGGAGAGTGVTLLASRPPLAAPDAAAGAAWLQASLPHLLHGCEARPGWFRQYVHASGTAFVRVHAGGAHWLPNRGANPASKQQQQLLQQQQGAAAALAPWVAAGRAAQAPAGSAAAGARVKLPVGAAGDDCAADGAAGADGGCCQWAYEETDDATLGRLALFRALGAYCRRLQATLQ